MGRKAINPRIVIGGLIIKHKLNLSQEETVLLNRENPFMQFFLGLDIPTLFTECRKKLGNDTFNEFADVLTVIFYGDKIDISTGDKEKLSNRGKLELNATVADQNITYPNDLRLLNTAREKTEKMIDFLFDSLRDQLKVKSRTYRKVARQKFLAKSKKRQKDKTTLRSTIRYHLNCMDRNIGSINMMLDLLKDNPLGYKKMREFWIIQTLNDQQKQMYDRKENRCDDRMTLNAMIEELEKWRIQTNDPFLEPEKLSQLTTEMDSINNLYPDHSYRGIDGFRWGYLEYLQPDLNRQ